MPTVPTVTDTFRRCRARGTPLIAIGSPDQLSLVPALASAIINGKGRDGPPVIRWDGITGYQALSVRGEEAIAALGVDPVALANPIAALEAAGKLPPGSCLILLQAQRYVEDATVATGLLLLRDTFKADGRTCVLVGPSFTLPPELRQDVVLLDEDMPDDAAVEKVASDLLAGADLPIPDPAVMGRVVDSVRGLSLFAAEQVFSMAMEKDSGIDLLEAWKRKRATVNQTRGLSMASSGPTFDQVGGLASICRLTTSLFSGPTPPRCVVRVDEIEKALAGAVRGDTSGTSTDALGAILQWMEDRGHTGFIAVGPPGSGKTLVSQAIGSTFGVPTLALDLGATKGSLVGESEKGIRDALKVADGVAAGRALIVATCNGLDSLPPELKRRFKLGIWYFDPPTAEERTIIWRIQRQTWNIDPAHQLPDDNLWTGAEIRNCCEIAASLGCPLVEASLYVVPIAKAEPAKLEALRAQAVGRFLSASQPGVYSRSLLTADGQARKLGLT